MKYWLGICLGSLSVSASIILTAQSPWNGYWMSALLEGFADQYVASVTVHNTGPHAELIGLNMNLTSKLPRQRESWGRAAPKERLSARKLKRQVDVLYGLAGNERRALALTITSVRRNDENPFGHFLDCFEDPTKCVTFYNGRTAERPSCLPILSEDDRFHRLYLDYTDVWESCEADDILAQVLYVDQLYPIVAVSVDPADAVITPEGRRTPPEYKPNDPLSQDQWSLHLFRQGVSGRIGDGAWSNLVHRTPLKFKPRILLLCNGGVDLTHPDLDVYVNEAEYKGVKGVDDDKNGYIDDITGWTAKEAGTMPDGKRMGLCTELAGIAAARTNNGVGISSPAIDAQVFPCSIYDSKNQTSDAQLKECLEWGVAMEVQIALLESSELYNSESSMSASRRDAWAAFGDRAVFMPATGKIKTAFSKETEEDVETLMVEREASNPLTQGCWKWPTHILVSPMGKDWMPMKEAMDVLDCPTFWAPAEDIMTTVHRSHSNGVEYARASKPEYAAAHMAGMGAYLLHANPMLNAYDYQRILPWFSIEDQFGGYVQPVEVFLEVTFPYLHRLKLKLINTEALYGTWREEFVNPIMLGPNITYQWPMKGWNPDSYVADADYGGQFQVYTLIPGTFFGYKDMVAMDFFYKGDYTYNYTLLTPSAECCQ